jgi:hypothetical protein
MGLLVLSWMLFGALLYLHKDHVQLVKLPPDSLAQWYKPENKRQVWLHNMFKLRREMQAVEMYASQQQAEPLALWMDRLVTHYRQIREMVPEWSSRLDHITLNDLMQAQQTEQFAQIEPLLSDLRQSCDSCHSQFRAVTAMLYRAPNFEELRVKTSLPLLESMASLNVEVNNIKIAIGEQDRPGAMDSLHALKVGMREMSTLCENCHTFSPQVYPNEAISRAVDELQVALNTADAKQQSEALGVLAVKACASCHGTHRLAYDASRLLRAKPGIVELFRH